LSFLEYHNIYVKPDLLDIKYHKVSIPSINCL